MQQQPTRHFPVRAQAALNTPEKVDAVRAGLATKSTGYRAATGDPFAVIATGRRREADIPF